MLRDARGQGLLALLEFARGPSVEPSGGNLLEIRVLEAWSVVSREARANRTAWAVTSVPNLFCKLSPKIFLLTTFATREAMTAACRRDVTILLGRTARHRVFMRRGAASWASRWAGRLEEQSRQLVSGGAVAWSILEQRRRQGKKGSSGYQKTKGSEGSLFSSGAGHGESCLSRSCYDVIPGRVTGGVSAGRCQVSRCQRHHRRGRCRR